MMALSVLAALGIAAAAAALLLTIRIARPHLRKARMELRETAGLARVTAASTLAAEQALRGQPTLSVRPQGPLPTSEGWVCIGGDGSGWDGDLFYKVRSLARQRDTLFASLTGPKQDGPRGEVWALDQAGWRCVAGGGLGPWPDEPAFVDQIAAYEGALYAAAARRVWRYADGRWSDAAGRVTSSDNGGPYAFAATPDGLAVSFWGEPAVGMLTGSGYRRLPDPRDGWGDRTRTVYCLAWFRGQLYAGTGTGKLEAHSVSVFRFDGRDWERVGGGGIRGSWSQAGIPFVLSLRPFGDHLIATLSRPRETPVMASNVWAFDGHEWKPVAFGRTPDLMARSLIMNDCVEYDGRLMVATGDSDHRAVRVWALDEQQRWHDASGQALEGLPSSRSGGMWIYCLHSDGHSLFAGTAGHQGSARVYRYTPPAIAAKG